MQLIVDVNAVVSKFDLLTIHPLFYQQSTLFIRSIVFSSGVRSGLTYIGDLLLKMLATSIDHKNFTSNGLGRSLVELNLLRQKKSLIA